MEWTAPLPETDDAYLRTRLDAVYSTAFAVIGMDVLGCAMMAGLFWHASFMLWLPTWVVLRILVTLSRSACVIAYRSNWLPRVSIRHWADALVTFALISGALWGAAFSAVIANGNDQQLMFAVCVVLGGLTLTITNVAYWPVYAAFEIPVMGFAAFGLVISDRPGHWALAGAAFLMGTVLLGTSHRLARQILQAHRLAVDKQALVESLGERRRELEHACDALERVSRTDPLTGLANRRSRDLRLAEEWARAQRCGGTLAVVAIDVDHFKRFNDTHGHAEGDRALKAVADMLEAGVRGPIDLAARHGGEEFMLILPGVDVAGAASIAERVRVMVANCSSDAGFALPEKVTVSLGVAAIEPSPGRSLHDLTIAADAALYQAKLAGRNRYEIATIKAVAHAA